MRVIVVVHSTKRQIVGAPGSEYFFEDCSADPCGFEARPIQTPDDGWTKEFDGRPYIQEAKQRRWLNEDLQSFTALRLAPAELTKHQGRSLDADQDVICILKVNELPNRGLQRQAIMARNEALELIRRTPTLNEQPLFTA